MVRNAEDAEEVSESKLVLLSITFLYKQSRTTSLYPLNSDESLTRRREFWVNDMRNLVIGSIIILTIALIYGASAQVNLSGANGETVLNDLSTPGLAINTSANVVLGSSETGSMDSTQNQLDQMSQQVLFGDEGGWLPD